MLTIKVRTRYKNSYCLSEADLIAAQNGRVEAIEVWNMGSTILKVRLEGTAMVNSSLTAETKTKPGKRPSNTKPFYVCYF